MRTFTRLPDGAVAQGKKMLGSGGQGEVWLASVERKDVAVKVYHKHTATPKQRAVLERLVKAGPPARYFLWPLSLVEDQAAGTYGYVMELREQRFRTSEDFMARRVEPSFRALMTAAWQLADGFLQLHSQGLCYQDISFGNIFFDPHTGDIRICDNDNVDVPGAPSGGVLGTPRFMAPEVVRRGEASPSDHTDRYSLAVLLFYLLMGGHPLDGAREAKIRCLDVPALEKLYGYDPLYIFDPADPSNAPVRGIHDNPLAFWSLYPAAVREHFERSFTEGLHYPNKRVRESEWRKVFARARDSILYCASCQAENFYDAEALRSAGGQSCWNCGKALTLPPRIRIGNDVVLLNHDTRLYTHHVGHHGAPEEVIAEVVRNPQNPSLFGLKNVTTEAWTITKPDGAIVDVPPGRAAPILQGNKINFGPATGEIRG
jgi:DNA-binding helix-hairpin-helix protein with protein kinase domain